MRNSSVFFRISLFLSLLIILSCHSAKKSNLVAQKRSLSSISSQPFFLDQDWEASATPRVVVGKDATEACIEFEKFVFGAKKEKIEEGKFLDYFRTDGIVIFYNDQLAYENYANLTTKNRLGGAIGTAMSIVQNRLEPKYNPNQDSSTNNVLSIGEPLKFHTIPNENETSEELETHQNFVNQLAYTPNTAHVLWSISKTVTATLIERAIQEKVSYRGVPFTLQRRLHEFFEVEEVLASIDGWRRSEEEKQLLREQVIKNFNSDAFRETTIEHLVNMSVPFDWNEFYEDDQRNSTFLPMLYLTERAQTAHYALSAPFQTKWQKGQEPRIQLDWQRQLNSMPSYHTVADESALRSGLPLNLSHVGQYFALPTIRRLALNDDFLFGDIVFGPGQRTRYSGGNSNILQAILRKIYPNDYETIAWRLLFEPLGMKEVRWERDESGLYIGSSYAYMRPRDMAKYGYLYLAEGRLGDRQLLSRDWVRKAQVVTEGLKSATTTEGYVKKLGVQSERVFWLNQPILHAENGKVKMEQEFPELPSDMYFSAGHYGQLILVIPSKNLVLARTGHDLSYWDHITPLVKKTLACLEDHKDQFGGSAL